MSANKMIVDMAFDVLAQLKNRLDYHTEYLPLLDCANALERLYCGIDNNEVIELKCPRIGDIVYCFFRGAINATNRTQYIYTAKCKVLNILYSVANKTYRLFVEKEDDKMDRREVVFNETAFTSKARAEQKWGPARWVKT